MLALIGVRLTVGAEPRSMADVLSIAHSAMGRTRAAASGDMQLLTFHPAYYIANAADEGGFVIVSADDRFTPVLGCCSQGCIRNEADMPDALRYWLGVLAREMSAAEEAGYQKCDAAASHRKSAESATLWQESIAPLVTTKWAQTTPYNNLIPTFATGCVATATAQVMKFWNYPEHGTGQHTNSFFTDYSADFGTTTYDWANMKDEYGGKRDTKAEVAAVATLMYHLGVATDMRWTTNNSATPNMYAAYALVTFFGYNRNLHSETRDHLSPQAWKEMLLQQLSTGHPLCYAGMTSETSSEGHFFVCDGYDAQTDRFHFNWGWGGRYDGYYALSALDPLAQDEVGALTGSFNYCQQIFVDVQPTLTGSYVARFDCERVYPFTMSSPKDAVAFRTVNLTNNALLFEGSVGLAIYAADGQLCQYVPSTQTFPGPLSIGKTNSGDYDVSVNLSDVADGTYTVCLAVQDNNHPGTPYAIRAFYGNATYYEMTVRGSQTSFKPLNSDDVNVGVASLRQHVPAYESAYNLSGRRIPSGEGKAKGIYVANGRKFIKN